MQILRYRFVAVVIVGLLLSGCSLTPTQTDNDSLSDATEGLPTVAPTGQAEALTDALQASEAAEIDKQELSTKAEEAMEATQVTISTPKGVMELTLYPDKAPKTVENFLNKVASGFYNGLTFHRVESWVVQGGDPDGNGTGGGKMTAEYNDVPFKIGSLGIARGMDKAVNNDSQFFICTDECAWLTGEYTNFGEVTSGMDVAKKIAVGDTITKITVK